MLRLLVIIPAFNEEDNIKNVLKDLLSKNGEFLELGFQTEILVVNDCSKDRTASIVTELGIKLLDLPVNLGIGGAMQCGYKYALRNNFDFALQLDGDGQHPPSEIVKILNATQTDNADIIIGSRFLDKKGFQSTYLRRIGINYFKNLNKFLIGLTIFDSTSGFRLFNRRAVELACKYYPDEYPEPESIVYFALNKLKISETPVIMAERIGGVSSIRSFKSIYYMVKVTLSTFFVFIRFNKK
jgi:glycosyltransferase involved in cell wall biosynthesis